MVLRLPPAGLRLCGFTGTIFLPCLVFAMCITPFLVWNSKIGFWAGLEADFDIVVGIQGRYGIRIVAAIPVGMGMVDSGLSGIAMYLM